ncbi:hypothetical protein NQ315_000219 [Exocentrus adspersus]|uniref:DNA repair protein REV1 n=1 Tax=Exocentrus adspersus TaxID=1586481 RepID=A0AAV8VR04_9CUCU|nr:hypothetical protein NQ315_000219 [Exocentrus adspersus]
MLDGFGANRLQARLATRKAKPCGQYYLQADDVEMYMSEIPLADLPGVGYATLSKLRNLGLNTCGDVQVASLKVLQNEIGQKAGETLKEQARGVDKRPLNFHHERKSVSTEVNYGIRFKTLKECYSFLLSLSEEVYNRLNSTGMRARSLTLKLLVRAADAPVVTAKFLGCGVCDSLTKTVSNVILNDAQAVYKEVKNLGIGVHLTKLEKNAPVNKALSNFLKQATAKQAAALPPQTSIVTVTDSGSEGKQREGVSVLSKQAAAKSKKGRPKGANSSSRGRNATPAPLDKFFAKDKGVEGHGKVQKPNLGNPQIDLNVLNELPEELRNEIIKEYGLDFKLGECAMKLQPKTLENESKTQEQSFDVPKKNLFSGLSWEQIKPIIRKWVESSDEPSEVDVVMLAEHFQQLAIDREIDLLKSVFNFLHRVFTGLSCKWHKAYFLIVNIVQGGMVARYGGTLMVNRRFECCRM